MMERITLSFANRSAALLIGLGCITATLAQTNNIAINNDWPLFQFPAICCKQAGFLTISPPTTLMHTSRFWL